MIKGKAVSPLLANRPDALDSLVGNPDTNSRINSEARIVISPVWCYTLVLPDTITANAFCRKIYKCFCRIGKGRSPIDCDTAITQKPLQDYIWNIQTGLNLHPFTITITSAPDRDQLVAEIWYKESLVAAVNQERDKGDFALMLYPAGKQAYPYEEFLGILEMARRKLTGI